MKVVFTVVQVASAILLMIAILLQNRGTGLSATFGGEGNVYRTKRGVERIFFIATIVLSFIFFGASFTRLFIR